MTDVVYNFVLDDGHVVEINGIVCATFGHGMKGENIEHPYFGTSQIVEDLKKMPGWNEGFIIVQIEQFRRSQNNDQVCRIEIAANQN